MKRGFNYFEGVQLGIEIDSSSVRSNKTHLMVFLVSSSDL